MRLAILAFTEKGWQLGNVLQEEFRKQGQKVRLSAGFGEGHISLNQWTKDAFGWAQGLIFIGAAAIAVRAVAPFLCSKMQDPAVVVLDEKAHFCISLLSGHLGGANELAEQTAALIGAVPVITTATDINGKWAVDLWAKRERCQILQPSRIKKISARIIKGEIIGMYSEFPVSGTLPESVRMTNEEHADIILSIHSCKKDSEALQLVPCIAVVGIGCRKGIPQTQIAQTWQQLLEKGNILPEAVRNITSIDLKKKEPGILDFCETHHLPFETYSAEELNQVTGQFTSSVFVQKVTGSDNVCERSAVLGSGGSLIIPKIIGNGVTMALALSPFAPSWNEKCTT